MLWEELLPFALDFLPRSQEEEYYFYGGLTYRITLAELSTAVQVALFTKKERSERAQRKAPLLFGGTAFYVGISY